MKLYGRNPVIERLRHNPSSIRRIHLQRGISGVAAISKKAQQHNIPIVWIEKSKVNKISRNHNTQGIIVDVEDFAYLPYEELLENAKKKKRIPVFLDGITDPQNFGAIIRSLACMGKFSLVIPTHKSVSVTEAVLRVASGGDNFIQISQVSNIAKAVEIAKDEGFNIAGTIVGEGKSIYEVKFPKKLALVVGSEQKGIRDTVKKNLDLVVTIPMYTNTMSMNVAQAATIFCYEITKQKANEV